MSRTPTRELTRDARPDERTATLLALINDDLLRLHEASAGADLALADKPELSQRARRIALLATAAAATVFGEGVPRLPFFEDAMSRVPASLTLELEERPEFVKQLVSAADALVRSEILTPDQLSVLDSLAQLLAETARLRNVGAVAHRA